MVQRRVGTAGHAEDILQETMLRAFTRRDQLRADAKFRNWLWSIAANEVRLHFRRDRGIVSLDEFPDIPLRDPGMSPVARLEYLERGEWLRGCIAKLSECDQAAIHLRDIEEKDLEDVAEALHSSASAAKTAHFRARRRLAQVIHANRPAA